MIRKMNRFYVLIAMLLVVGIAQAQEKSDSVTVSVPQKEIPLWKQKLYYGYNFDIYFHPISGVRAIDQPFSFLSVRESWWK